MYFLGALSFGMGYLVEKYELLRVSRRPLMQDGDLAQMATQLQPWAALPHIAFALYAYSLFHAPASGASVPGLVWLVESSGRLWAAVTTLTPAEVAERFTQRTALPHFLLLFIVGGFLVLLALARTWGSALLSAAYRLAGKEYVPRDMEGNPNLSVAISTHTLLGAKTFDMRDRAQYAYFFMQEQGTGDDVVHDFESPGHGAGVKHRASGTFDSAAESPKQSPGKKRSTRLSSVAPLP